MYVTISRGETRSVKNLVQYCDKENELSVETIGEDKSLSGKFTDYLNKENELDRTDYFFNESSYEITKEEVTDKIDHNRKGLKNNETFFYSLTFDPSREEINFMLKLADEEADKLEKIGIGNKEENKEWLMRDMLKIYTQKSMDLYAKNFDREGINSSKDLVWFGKVEKNRYWKWKDKEVANNRKITREIKKFEKKGDLDKVEKLRNKLILESDVRRGGKDVPIFENMPKSGNNYHIHVIVSRRDKTQKMSLSPLAKARSNNEHKINGRECKIGFDRNIFSQEIERNFDQVFDYKRSFHESFLARKTLKFEPGKYEERKAEFYQNYEYAKEEVEKKVERTNEKNIHGIQLSFPKGSVQSVAQQAGFNQIDRELDPYKKFTKFGSDCVKVLKSQNSLMQQKQLLQLAKRTIMDYCSIAGAGALPVGAVGLVIGGISAVKGMLVGKDREGIEM